MPENILKNTAGGDLSAIILAGGYSSRMQAFKPLLPLGGSTVLENTVKVFRDSGIQDITVVTGYRAEELEAVLDRAGVLWVYNKDYSEGMYTSVVAGVRSLHGGSGGFFLLPADMPLVKRSTIRALREAQNRNTSHVIYPVHNGRRGHPPFIPASLFSDILAWDGSGGLRALLSRHQDRVIHVETGDEGILTDIDTPEDYKRLRRMFEASGQD